MPELRTLMSGLVFGEQPRWHEGWLWFSDWGTQEVIAVDLGGTSEVILRGPSFPLCVDWLPDGTLLLVSARDGLLLRCEHDGSLVAYGDLKAASDPPAINELVVDGRGNAYVNGGGFDMMAGEQFAPGVIALVAPGGGPARLVAGGLAFPNGMLVMPGGSALIVAESYAQRLTAFDIDTDGGLVNRRVWADLGDGVPDSICADDQNAVWYADAPPAPQDRLWLFGVARNVVADHDRSSRRRSCLWFRLAQDAVTAATAADLPDPRCEPVLAAMNALRPGDPVSGPFATCW